MITTRRTDGGQFGGDEGQEQATATPRTLVYDVEMGSLRFSRPRAAHPKSPTSHLPPSSLNMASDGGKESLRRLHSEDGSGESSPRCVIRNSTLRSNSSSPTMSSVSKASSETDRISENLQAARTIMRMTKYGSISPSDGDEEILLRASPGFETHKVGRGRGSKKLGSKTPSRPGLKGAYSRQTEKDSSSAKENGWPLMAQDAGKGKTQSTPFKAIQSAATPDRTEEAKKKHGGIPSGFIMRSSPQSASVMTGAPGIFSFNATYMSARATDDVLHNCDQHGVIGGPASFDAARIGGHCTAMGSLMKSTPSKWDDADKWLAGSDVPVRTKARSGPLLAHMVANQAGMALPRKIPPHGLIGRHSGAQTAAGLARPASSCDTDAEDGAEAGDLKISVDTPKLFMTTAQGAGGAFLDFSANSKQQLNMLLDQHLLGDLKSREDGNAKDGSASPQSCHGSFFIGAQTEKPAEESPPAIDDTVRKPDPNTKLPSDAPPTVSMLTVSMRDMGTEMTPIASVEPSRTATPVGATTPEKSPIGSGATTPDQALSHAKSVNDADARSNKEPVQTRQVLTEEELQAKTRQEILALGTQLGKANIAAWASKEEASSISTSTSTATATAASKSLKNNTTLDLDEIRRTVLATRAAAWEEAEKAKYTSRFQREEARIQAWEKHEKAKAEAEMHRIEVKVERMRSDAHEKLMNKLAAAERQAEELRAAAEARRTAAAATTAKHADIIKKTGKFPSFMLFTSLLCT